MSFINLKVKRDKTNSPEVCCGKSTEKDNAPNYDYGTRITFGKEVLAKLGLDLKKFSTDDKMEATVKLEVVSTRDIEGPYPEKSMELQITDIDLGEVKTSPGASKIAGYKKVRDEGPTQEG
ncbi:MAG: capsid staple protein [Smithella sp.]